MKLVTIVMFAVSMAIGNAAQAQTSPLAKPECSKANIASVEEKVKAMKDGRQKETASSEVAAAKTSLDKNQTDDCQEHLLKATVQTK